ncbi:hypothetical protein CRP01_39370 [Flavilitoribacter nigricans DSM 23189 = NBRC 102662]|uniref:Uncharacterized protein n=1 Tax=Flavilitoribacter nigricans (strain ATCC 23147 / DSM 23189 / NBRC 102662 / NCIMB 1420 / SS-2) TaxID=1122177 RepID=A0A2D0MXU8_FLAN2|nr:hypothetical protein CRP01_39370 [Flavilitoribacter nigricans DSM 23189 = NBRC 102662]
MWCTTFFVTGIEIISLMIIRFLLAPKLINFSAQRTKTGQPILAIGLVLEVVLNTLFADQL